MGVQHETLLIYMCDVTHLYMGHDCYMTYSCVCHDGGQVASRGRCVQHETWRNYTCDMTYSCVEHDFLVCVTWRIHIHMCVMMEGKWLVEQGCATWDMTHLYVGHDSFLCGTYVWHDSLTCGTWLLSMCYMTYSFVCRNSGQVAGRAGVCSMKPD